MLYRVYFNRKREAPQVWSIDEGTQASEINVASFFIGTGCTARGRYNGQPANDNSPSAWLEVSADQYFVARGMAMFVRLAADGRP